MGSLRLTNIAASAIALIIAALFIGIGRTAWGIIFILLAVLLAKITGK